jgi:hypothetical protein
MFEAIEDAVVARLRDKLGPDIQVHTETDAEKPGFRQIAPSVALVYDGFSLGDQITPTGIVQQVQLEWFTVVNTRSAKERGDTVAARNEAAAIAVKVMEALLGFHVGAGKYFRLHDAPGPSYDAGHCLLPLAWRCAATFKGQP